MPTVWVSDNRIESGEPFSVACEAGGLQIIGFEKLGFSDFFSILQFLVSALEIPSRFRFRSGSLDFSSFGTMDLLVRRRP